MWCSQGKRRWSSENRDKKVGIGVGKRVQVVGK